MQITIPSGQLTAAQYEQLKLDVSTACSEKQPNDTDSVELWALCEALWYLIQNPTPPEE